MKIANILISNKNGGVEQSFVNYCHLLKNINHEVLAIVKTNAPYISDLKKLKVKVVEIDNKFSYYDFCAISKIRKAIKDFGVNLVFAHTGRAIILAKKSIKKSFKIPLIAVNHSNNVKRSIGADIILSVNKEIFYKTVDLGQSPETSFVMPNSIEFDHISNKGNIKDFSLSSKPVITLGALGRLAKEKGFEYLIRSVKILKDKGYKIKLHLAGSGEEEENLKNLAASLNVEKEVVFLGWIDNSKLSDFFSKIDIFCLSSMEETFGIVLLEAMKYKKPIITTNCDGPKTIIKNNFNGILVEKQPVENLPDNICESVIKIINDSDLIFDLVTNAQNDLLKNYSIKSVQEKIIEVIRMAFKNKF